MYWDGIPAKQIQHVLATLENDDAVQKDGPDVFLVLGVKTGHRRVRVVRRDDELRCRQDHANQDNPCTHILVVLVHEGLLPRPDSSGTVYRKGDSPRNHALETQAWERVPTRAPELLALLLREALPVFAPEPPANPKGGQSTRPRYPQVYQSVMRVLFRKSLRCIRGELRSAQHLQHNPHGPVGIATISRFLADPLTTALLEKLLAITTWPVRSYESLVHPDGTGLTQSLFTSYFDERPATRNPEEKPPKSQHEPDGPRHHVWSYTEILWTYRYTLIAALHAEPSQFGEARWLLPLLQRAGLMLRVEELGGDKAYDADYIFQYAKKHGIAAYVKIRDTPIPTRVFGAKKYRKAKLMESRTDVEGYARKANRSSNVESGNHAFKAILGDAVYNRGHRNDRGEVEFTSRRNEILCMALAYNLTRLVYYEAERGVHVDFQGGVDHLAAQPWVSLEDSYASFAHLWT